MNSISDLFIKKKLNSILYCFQVPSLYYGTTKLFVMKLKLNHALKKSLYLSINMNYLSLKLDYSPNVCVKGVRPRIVTTNFFLVGCITLHDTSFSICFKEKSVFWHTQFTMTSLLEHSVAQSHSVANYVCTFGALTVFLRIVPAETILLWGWNIWIYSYSFHNNFTFM